MPSKTKRRDQGAGALFQDSRGLWTARVELPAINGQRRRKVIRRKDKAAALAELRRLRTELDRVGDLATSSPTLADWLSTWLERIAAPRLKPRTLVGYRGYIDRYIVPTIGKTRLDKLTATHVRRLHDHITAQGLSSTTALQAHRILAKALTDAVREGKVGRNVATLTDAPRRAVALRKALDAAQARALLLSVADRPEEAAAWSVALLAGLRQGERLGLTAGAVDLDAGIITVSWQLQRLRWAHGCAKHRPAAGWPCGRVRAGSCPDRRMPIPAGQEARQVDGGLWLTRPKSRAGWRQVPIAPLLAQVLERHLAGRALAPDDLVFTRPDGRPVDPSDDTAAWDTALRRAELPDVVLHSARHTTATLLYELGVPEHTRVRILGHSSATTTAGYTHVADALTRDAMGRLGDLLTAPDVARLGSA